MVQLGEGSGPKHNEMVGRGMSACYVFRVTFLAIKIEHIFFTKMPQVYETGKLVYFTKNNLEVCYKSCIEHHEVGMSDEAQTAILHNLVCHFDK